MNANTTALISYKAPPTIARFMRSPAFYRGLMGPVGSGKSSACCVEILRRACAQAPGPDGVRRSRFAVVRNTYRELKDTTLRTWLAWIPEEHFGPYAHTDMRHLLKYALPDGARLECEVLFRALDRPRDVKKLLSLELTGAWFNEAREMDLTLIEAMGDRVERFPARSAGGCTWAGIIMDTNPPAEDHWWHRLAEGERPEHWAFFRQPGGVLEGPEGFRPNPEAENLENLAPDFYARRMAGKSAAHIRVYYAARYGFVQDGRPVYPEFARERHVAEESLRPSPELTLWAGLDFGLTPAAVLGQRMPDGRWVLLAELVAQDMGMLRFAGALKELLVSRFPGLTPVITGDPAGQARAQTDERTPYDILRAAGLSARPAPSNDPLLRREAVAAALARDIDGRPGLILDPSCRVLAQGMAGAWRHRRVQISGQERYADEPEKSRFSHVCEAAQYLLLGAGEGRALLTPQEKPEARQVRSVNAGRGGLIGPGRRERG